MSGLLLGLLFPHPVFAKVVDRVVAKVNGEIITLSKVEEKAILLKQQMSSVANPPNLSDRELIKDSLNLIIEEKLQLQEAKRARLEVDDEAVNKALDEIKTKNKISEAELGRMLESEGRSLEQYRNHIRDQILATKVVRFNMGKTSKVTDEQIKKYYFDHQKDYWVPKQPFVSHILFIADENLPEKDKQLKKAKANLILQKIRSGADFAEMARKYSEDISASSGGEVGQVKKGSLVPEFEEAVFTLQEGEVSDVVESRYGYHLIKVDKIIPGNTRPLDAVKEQINNTLAFEEQRKRYQEWMEELKKGAMIEITLFQDQEKEESQSKQALLQTGPVENHSPVMGEEAPEDKAGWEEASNAGKANGYGVNKTEFNAMEKKLTYIKKLRENRKISEGEYQERKRRLLDQL